MIQEELSPNFERGRLDQVNSLWAGSVHTEFLASWFQHLHGFWRLHFATLCQGQEVCMVGISGSPQLSQIGKCLVGTMKELRKEHAMRSINCEMPCFS